MSYELRLKRSHALIWGRGVAAAQRAFNSPGGGSNPSGPTVETSGIGSPNELRRRSEERLARRGTWLRSPSASRKYQALVV